MKGLLLKILGVCPCLIMYTSDPEAVVVLNPLTSPRASDTYIGTSVIFIFAGLVTSPRRYIFCELNLCNRNIKLWIIKIFESSNVRFSLSWLCVSPMPSFHLHMESKCCR